MLNYIKFCNFANFQKKGSKYRTLTMDRDQLDLNDKNIGRTFRKILLPTVLGSVSISAVTLIDGIFIGHGVGALGIAAVNIVTPIYQIMAGLGLMMGVGCSVAISILLGQGKTRTARIHVTQALTATSLVVALLSLGVMAMPEKVSLLLGSSPTLLPLVKDYLIWIMPSFVFQMCSMIGLFVIRLDGAPQYAMWCNILPAALNVVLDWLFIFPLGMGVKGASIATGLSIITGGLMALYYLLRRTRTLHPERIKFSSKSIRLSLRNLSYHARIGSSTLMGELTLAVLFFIGNLVFMQYLGDQGVGAFGVACYYAPFFFMIGNAIAQSAQPIISFNYGKAQWSNVRKTRGLLIRTSLVSGIFICLLFLLLPGPLVSLFIPSDSQAGIIAIEGLPYFAIGFIFFILNVALIGYLQSIERIREATVYVLLRGFILLIPSFYGLPQLMGTIGIWLAMPVAECLTTAVILLRLFGTFFAKRK